LGINIYDTELLLNTTLINKAELSQIEIDRDTKTLYVLNENANRLEVFNLTNGTLLNTFAMASPRYFALVKL
jgi:6-phosphogluconolactonase (cycloisomerase 2 family)